MRLEETIAVNYFYYKTLLLSLVIISTSYLLHKQGKLLKCYSQINCLARSQASSCAAGFWTKPSRPRTQPSGPRTQPSRPRTQPSGPRTQPSRPRTHPSWPESRRRAVRQDFGQKSKVVRSHWNSQGVSHSISPTTGENMSMIRWKLWVWEAFPFLPLLREREYDRQAVRQKILG